MVAQFETETRDGLEYKFYPNSTGLVEFQVKATNDAHIVLTTSSEVGTPVYEFIIGGWDNEKSVLKKNQRVVTEAITPLILSAKESRGFRICCIDGDLYCAQEGIKEPFLKWKDPDPFEVKYVGISTTNGANGKWIVKKHERQPVWWVPAKHGVVPPLAFEGGKEDGRPLYIARAKVQTGLTPGKLMQRVSHAYFPQKGTDVGVRKYEVLCNFKGAWVSTSEGNIPEGAVQGGETDKGESLFIGRVHHQGAIIPGKVQASAKSCSVPYRGKEVVYKDYEILVM